MRCLLVMRHAKSSWKEASLDDHDRPLNRRGVRDAPRMGRLIREQELVPQRILCSTALRARCTAEMAGAEWDTDAEAVLSPSLYLASAESWIAQLRALPASIERVMIVGHNPGLEQLVERLAGRPVTLPTAALARIDLPIDDWSDLSSDTAGRRVELWRPRDLPPE